MDRSTWTALTERANTQLGLVGPEDVADLGISRQQMAERVRSGQMVRVRRGVWAVAGGVPPPEQPLLAAVLVVPQSVASHHSAAWLHGFDQLAPLPPHVTTSLPTHTPEPGGVCAHTTRRFHPDDLTVVRGVPCTSRARTACDLVYPGVHWTVLARFLDHLLVRRPTVIEEVDACVKRLHGPGHAGFDILRLLCEERRPGAPSHGPLATKIVAELVRLGVPRPTIEYEITVGGVVRHLDAAWVPHRVGLEIKGALEHGKRHRLDEDAVRENALVASGWTLFSATSRTDLPRLARQILSICAVKHVA